MVKYLSNLKDESLGVLFVTCMKSVYNGKEVKVIHLKELDYSIVNFFNVSGIDFSCFDLNETEDSEKELLSVANEFDLFFTDSTTEGHSLPEYIKILNIMNTSCCPVQLVHSINLLTQLVEIPSLFLLVNYNHKDVNRKNTFFSIDSLIKNIAMNNPNESTIGLYHEEVIPLDELHIYKNKNNTLDEIKEMETNTFLATLEEDRGLYHSCLFAIRYIGSENLDLPVNYNINAEVLARVIRAVLDQFKSASLPNEFEIYLQGDKLPYPLINQVAVHEYFIREYDKVVNDVISNEIITY